jgi:uncharacterized membrane protein
MLEFSAALAAFLAAHSLPAMPGTKARLVAALGQRGYTLAYSALSLLLLVWVIAAARRAPYIPLWEPALWQWWFAIALTPFAFLLLILGAAQPNPLSVSFRRGEKPGAIVAVTRHPVLWGFTLWAVAHVPANGDLVSLVLFGGMALFSLLGMRIVDRRARRRLGEERWRALVQAASAIPFAALVAGRARFAPNGATLALAVLALALYAWFLLDGHARLIGLDPLAAVAS